MIVKEINGMQGLFASQEYKINDLLFTIEGEILDTPTRTSIQISTTQHINVQAPLAFINHSCFPNISIENQQVKVIHPIQSGDQICFNYNETEMDLANKFECVECGQWIKGRLFAKDFPCLKGSKNVGVEGEILQENF
jgi:hypothetical protein